MSLHQPLQIKPLSFPWTHRGGKMDSQDTAWPTSFYFAPVDSAALLVLFCVLFVSVWCTNSVEITRSLRAFTAHTCVLQSFGIIEIVIHGKRWACYRRRGSNLCSCFVCLLQKVHAFICTKEMCFSVWDLSAIFVPQSSVNFDEAKVYIHVYSIPCSIHKVALGRPRHCVVWMHWVGLC